MSFPRILEGLSPREQITDALNRVILGIDANNLEMFESGFATTAEPSFVLRGEATKGLENMKKGVFDRVGPMDTLHIVSVHRIDYKEGATTASMTANAIANHGCPGQGFDGSAPMFMSGGIYYVDLIKEGMEWKITKWELKVNWLQGDPSVMETQS